MGGIFELLGLETNWLPALLGLVGLPLLYASLATDVHRECASLLKDASERTPALDSGKLERLLSHIDGRTQLFRMDWWVVGAFGALLFAIMSCSSVQTLCTSLTPFDPGAMGAGSPVPLCSDSFKIEGLKGDMALYGSLFAILIGFRLIWARVELAREAKTYYACGFNLECPRAPPRR